MLRSLLRRAVVRGSDGQPAWKEVSQLHFPKGGKTLSFKTTSLYVFVGCMAVFLYAHMQSQINPKSKWADGFNSLMTEPAKYLGLQKKEAVPMPTMSSHVE